MLVIWIGVWCKIILNVRADSIVSWSVWTSHLVCFGCIIIWQAGQITGRLVDNFLPFLAALDYLLILRPVSEIRIDVNLLQIDQLTVVRLQKFVQINSLHTIVGVKLARLCNGNTQSLAILDGIFVLKQQLNPSSKLMLIEFGLSIIVKGCTWNQESGLEHGESYTERLAQIFIEPFPAFIIAAINIDSAFPC